MIVSVFVKYGICEFRKGNPPIKQKIVTTRKISIKMSDFMPSDILPDLWEEILKLHWTFLETDGSIQKIEEGKKLENCLKEFLCIVPHDRKFFLPETSHVLRKSVREMEEFNAYKAIIGFRLISHYANNLFTKPWRKEFRVLKMYSGFYQHEIKSNLLDAGKLFEAMGYRQISDEILVLDGPICPDQVTNVSRDAMAAYVECQIMEHIYAGLIAQGLTCSWQDVFHYREKFVGGTSQAIKGLAYAIQDKRLRKEKLINTDNCYASIQHLAQTMNITPKASECQNCALYNRMPSQTQHPMYSDNHGTCAFHATSTILPNHLYNGKLDSGHQHSQHSTYGIPTAGMQHSRSLEHYSEPITQLPHRHSFDHQQKGCTSHHYKPPVQLPSHHVYESPYDCLDAASMGGSSVSYAAVVASLGGPNNGVNNCINSAYSHPYNVSGNRYPLPYNISNQLNSHYATPNVPCNGIKGELYNSLDNGGYATISKPHNCNYHQPPVPPIRHSSVLSGAKDFQTYRQRSFPPDQHLIEFDERAPLESHDFHAQLHGITHCNSVDYDREQDRERERDRMVDRRLCRTTNISPGYAQPRDIVMPHQCVSHAGMPSVSQQPSSENMYGGYVYARPLPKADRSKFNVAPKYERNTNILEEIDNNEKQLHMQTMELKDNTTTLNGVSGIRRKVSTHTNETSDLSYDSNCDDFVLVGHSEHPSQSSPTQASKNQDGVGSFESWNYVFKNLERSGYSKDLSERGDLLVQGLNLDSMNLSNGGGGNVSGTKATVERRRSNNVDLTNSSRQTNNDLSKARTLDKTNKTTTLPEMDKRDEKKLNAGVVKQQEKSILKQPGKKAKSALKQTSNTVAPSAHDNNNGNNQYQTDRNVRVKNKKQSVAITQSSMSGQSEWSCRFCTFLNPETKRVCEMCCRSKDFNEATASHTPTCV